VIYKRGLSEVKEDVHCWSMTEKKRKQECRAILLPSDCKPGGSLTKRPWVSSSAGESLHVKGRPTFYRRREKACRQLHLEDTSLTFLLHGTCQ